MIRYTTMRKDGRQHVGLIIDDENIRRLKNGLPILFDAANMGFDGTVSIEWVPDATDLDTIKALRARMVAARTAI